MAAAEVGLSADTRAFRELAANLHGADDAVRREFSRALRDVAKPYGRYVLVAGAKRLPHRGGLDYRVAGGTVTVQASTLRAAVTLRTKERYDLSSIDRGRLRHPVFARNGRRRRWVNQDVTPGVFTEAFESGVEQIRPAMVEAGERVLRTITGGATG